MGKTKTVHDRGHRDRGSLLVGLGLDGGNRGLLRERAQFGKLGDPIMEKEYIMTGWR